MATDIIIPNASLLNESSLKTDKLPKLNGHPGSHKNLTVLKKLSKGKYPVYLATSRLNNQNYVMKIFTYTSEKTEEQYNNELRFASLRHPHVISFVHSESNKKIIQNGTFVKASYILSEYAPHGDMFDLIINHKDEIDDKLTRTYFRQLIDGMEYLHSIGVAHLDLKPENLLLDADFNLKIADFDLSYVASDDKVLSRGTRYYRGPEFYKSTSTVQLELPSASDIYSAGIILFVLKSGGVYAHLENRIVEGVNLTELIETDHKRFWSKHHEMQGNRKGSFDKTFRDLFDRMVKSDPKQRITIKEIKQSKWYNGPVYTPLELYLRMKTILRN